MPPSVNSTLHPIVIPEMIVPPHFTCLGSGLLQSGHPRESSSSLAALLLPSMESPRGIPNTAKAKTWWRAQCLHYGINMPVSATIERMRSRLEEALRSYSLEVPAELLDMEHKKCGEFRKLNAQVREQVTGGGSASGGKEKGKSKEATTGGGGAKKAKAPAKEKEKATAGKGESKKKSAEEEMITTTTITTTTTTMKRNASPAPSRGGSGAGAAKAAKVAKTAKAAKAGGVGSTAAKSAGVSKPKPAVKREKKVKEEDILRKQQEFLNSTNYTSPQGPRPGYIINNQPRSIWANTTIREQQEFLDSTNYTSPQGPPPSYLSANQPCPTWQTQAAPTLEPEQPSRIRNYARYSGPPRGGGNAGSRSGRSKWIPQSNGSYKQFGIPSRGRYGGGRSVSTGPQNHHASPVQQRTAENKAPPPAYGSWMQDEDEAVDDNESDYSDEVEMTAVRYEDFDILFSSGGATGQISTNDNKSTENLSVQSVDYSKSGTPGHSEAVYAQEIPGNVPTKCCSDCGDVFHNNHDEESDADLALQRRIARDEMEVEEEEEESSDEDNEYNESLSDSEDYEVDSEMGEIPDDSVCSSEGQYESEEQAELEPDSAFQDAWRGNNYQCGPMAMDVDSNGSWDDDDDRDSNLEMELYHNDTSEPSNAQSGSDMDPQDEDDLEGGYDSPKAESGDPGTEGEYYSPKAESDDLEREYDSSRSDSDDSGSYTSD